MHGSARERRPTARRLTRVGVLAALLVLLHAMFTPGHTHMPVPGAAPCAARIVTVLPRTETLAARTVASSAHTMTDSVPSQYCGTADPGTGPEDASGRDRHGHTGSTGAAAVGTLRLPTSHCTVADPGAFRVVTTDARPGERPCARGARRAPALPDPLLLGGVRRC